MLSSSSPSLQKALRLTTESEKERERVGERSEEAVAGVFNRQQRKLPVPVDRRRVCLGMGESGRGPAMAPLNVERGDQERWRHFDSSVNAVSFGFVATAILISMFLIMAIFERFLRPQSSLFASFTDGRAGGGNGSRRRNVTADLEAHSQVVVGKLEYPSPKMSIYARGVSVLMPGHDVPTFIAHPVPPPCPPEGISWPSHKQIPLNACSWGSS